LIRNSLIRGLSCLRVALKNIKGIKNIHKINPYHRGRLIRANIEVNSSADGSLRNKHNSNIKRPIIAIYAYLSLYGKKSNNAGKSAKNIYVISVNSHFWFVCIVRFHGNLI